MLYRNVQYSVFYRSICEHKLNAIYHVDERNSDCCYLAVIAAAIGSRKPATARHNDAFVNRDHSKLSA